MNGPETQPPRDPTLLSLILFDEDVVGFVLERDRPRIEPVRLPVSRTEIAKAAANLGEHFASHRIHARRPERTTDMEWLRPLGARMLAPLSEHLDRCRHLIVAPHRELHQLPLHMLESESGQPLGVTHTVSYVANLSLYGLLRLRARELPNSSGTVSCLSTAAKEDHEVVHDNFAAAPRRLRSMTGGVLFEGAEASVDRLSELAARSDILYLACHGLFDAEKPLESYLLLGDGRTLPSRGGTQQMGHRLTVRDLMHIPVSSRLVLLQACTSGNQSLSEGDEPIGFPTAFLLAGAQATIASNWVVERNAASTFMATLTEHWVNASEPLGEAYRHACAATRARHPHPFHWAAFSLFGNDQIHYRRNTTGAAK